MHTPSCSPETSLGLLFRQVRDVVRFGMERELAQSSAGFTFSQYLTLKRLAMGDARVTELAQFVELNPGAVTRLLDQLEARGLVARHADPDDRRALAIRLTDAGRQVLPALQACADRVRERALTGMTPTECDQLTRLLTQVRDNMSTPE